MKRLSKLIMLLFVIAAVTMCFVGCVKAKVVTFVLGEKEVMTLSADKEGKVYEPNVNVEVPDGKYIAGWYTDVNRTVEFKFETDKVEADTTLYAKLVSYNFSITYNLGYTEPEHGEDMPSAPTQNTVNLDDSFEVADAPNRVGYEFLGWTDGSDTYQPGETYEVEVSGNITLTATWTTKMFTVRFYDDVGLLVGTKNVPYGSEVSGDVLAPHTYPQCYINTGWDKDLTSIISDLDVYAEYEYQHADYSWFEFVPVIEDDQIVAYKLKMAPDEILPFRGKRFNQDGLWAFPETYEGKDVIGFAQPIEGLGMNVFEDTYYDISLFIPDSYEELGEGAFTSCTLKKLSFGRGIKFIHNDAFLLSNIEKFDVAEDNQFFSSDDAYLYNKDKTQLLFVYSRITDLVVEESVTYINQRLLYSSEYLETVTIKGNIQEIGAGAFAYCVNMTTVDIRGTIKKLVDGDDYANVEGDYMQDFPVFAFCRSLQSINLKGIEYIGFGTFTNCPITSIIIDTTIQFIGEECFVDLPNLAVLKFPGTATVSNNGKFVCEGNTLIEKEASEIMINETTHGDIFIYYAPKQERIHFDVPATVREFREYAFENANIESIVIPQGVKELPGGLFEGSNLISIEIPESVETLGKGDASRGAFMTNLSTVFGRSKLREVTFAENCLITEIPDSAFFATRLLTIEIPASVTIIGRTAFACDTITEITVAEGNECYEAENGVLYNSGKTEIHTYPAAKEDLLFLSPSTVETILDGAFSGVLKLKRVELNEGLKQIKPYAFLKSNIEEIIFPITIESVDVVAFEICYKFKYIEFKAEQPFTITDTEETGVPTVFLIQDLIALRVKVPFTAHSTYRQWLNDNTNGIGECIDVNDYPDEYVTKYVFISQGVSETVKAITLLDYPIPIWEGEETMYFNGWFKDEGTWQQEISVPCELDINTTQTYYARWETTQRKDGTSVLFAYELPIDQLITITLYSNIAYFKETLILDTEEYSICFLRLYVTGWNNNWFQIPIYKKDMPADFVKYVSVDFSDVLTNHFPEFNGFPYEIEVKFEIVLMP